VFKINMQKGGETAAERIALLFGAPKDDEKKAKRVAAATDGRDRFALLPPPPPLEEPPRRANDKVWVQVNDDDVQKWMRGTINSVDYSGEVSVKLQDGTIMKPGAENVVGYPSKFAIRLDKMAEQTRRAEEDERIALEAHLEAGLAKSEEKWRRSRWRR